MTSPASKVVAQIPIDRLRLDPENPRLPESSEPRSQDDLVIELARDHSLSEIGRSLAENGYFLEEPLAAIRRRTPPEEYTVVEGNRRLAALKLLADTTLRARVEKRTGLKMAEWADLARDSGHDLSEVPVIVYDRRRDLLTFMGFRHITGVKPWDPLAKARFIHRLVEEDGMDFIEAARTVGSKSNAVRQQYLSYRAFLQARDQFGMDVGGLERVYSIFTSALRNPNVRDFVGISPQKEDATNPKAIAHPVPRARAESLRDLVGWIAGEGRNAPAITDSRQLRDLAEVIASPPALSQFRITRNLVAARQLTGGEEKRLTDHLQTAGYHLDEALKDAHRHRKSTRVRAAFGRCVETVSELRRTFEK